VGTGEAVACVRFSIVPTGRNGRFPPIPGDESPGYLQTTLRGGASSGLFRGAMNRRAIIARPYGSELALVFSPGDESPGYLQTTLRVEIRLALRTAHAAAAVVTEVAVAVADRYCAAVVVRGDVGLERGELRARLLHFADPGPQQAGSAIILIFS
jgi:hypothetical protein